MKVYSLGHLFVVVVFVLRIAMWMLKGEWGHSMLHTLLYILVTCPQVDSLARA